MLDVLAKRTRKDVFLWAHFTDDERYQEAGLLQPKSAEFSDIDVMAIDFPGGKSSLRIKMRAQFKILR